MLIVKVTVSTKERFGALEEFLSELCDISRCPLVKRGGGSFVGREELGSTGALSGCH